MKKSKKGFWIFICPALFAFIVVQIIPTIMGIGYSFTDWNGVGKTKNFVGLNNYITTLTNDTQFRNAFLFTFLFSICAVITVNVIGFALAMLVTQKIKGSNLLRGIFSFALCLYLLFLCNCKLNNGNYHYHNHKDNCF